MNSFSYAVTNSRFSRVRKACVPEGPAVDEFGVRSELLDHGHSSEPVASGQIKARRSMRSRGNESPRSLSRCGPNILLTQSSWSGERAPIYDCARGAIDRAGGSHRVCQLTSSLRLLPPASFSRLRGWNFYSIKKPGDLGLAADCDCGRSHKAIGVPPENLGSDRHRGSVRVGAG